MPTQEGAGMPLTGDKQDKRRDPATGRFLPGNRSGGRPAKSEWLKGKGEEALRFAYEIMTSNEVNVAMRMQAAKMLVEYDLGKPRQAVDVVADMGEETRSAISSMSLSARGAAMRAAIEAYENGNKG